MKDTGFCNNHSGTDLRIFLGSTGLRTHLMKDIPPTPVTGTHQLNHLRSLGLPTSGLNSQPWRHFPRSFKFCQNSYVQSGNCLRTVHISYCAWKSTFYRSQLHFSLYFQAVSSQIQSKFNLLTVRQKRPCYPYLLSTKLNVLYWTCLLGWTSSMDEPAPWMTHAIQADGPSHI